jgi:hypothetical protein
MVQKCEHTSQRLTVENADSVSLSNLYSSINRRDIPKGYRPLYWAALFRYEDFAWTLLDYGANPFLGRSG